MTHSEWKLKKEALDNKKNNLRARVSYINNHIYQIMHSEHMAKPEDPPEVYGLKVMAIVLALEARWGASFGKVFHYMESAEAKIKALEDELKLTDCQLARSDASVSTPLDAWAEHIEEELRDL